jgi:transposase
MTSKNKRQYTAQTKIDAVGQILKAGLPLAQVARSYEMPVQTLENWVRIAKRGDAPNAQTASVSDQAAEISRLKAQCARLTMERDILKKATAYFAKDAL